MQHFSPIKQRIIETLENKGVSKYQFYKESGITRGVLDKDSGISEDNIAKFIAHFPDIDTHWLITGERKNGTITENEGRFNITLIPQHLSAGFPAIINDRIELSKLRRFTLPQLMYEMGDFFCFPIKGDSMHPTVKDKEWVIAKAKNLKPEEIIGGRCYAVFHSDYGIDDGVCKRLYYEDDTDTVKIVSDNELYSPYRISTGSLLYVYDIVIKISDDFRNWNTDIRKDLADLKSRILNLELSQKKGR